MPNAPTHDLITAVTGVALAPIPYFFLVRQGHPLDVVFFDTLLFAGAHLLSGIMFSPDLDIDSAIDNRWGPLFWLWRPYMWLTPHRRWFSHGLILPPVLRLVYLAGVLTLLFLTGSWLLAQLGIVVPEYHLVVSNYLLLLATTEPRRVSLFLFGFITGGAAHTIADWLATGGKRILRRLGLRVPQNHSGDRH